MLSPTMQEALNRHLQAELYSSYIYLAMAAFFETQELRGMSQWMRSQSGEETLHGMKFYDYILARDGLVTLLAIEQPPSSWDSPLAVFESALRHEESVTQRIHELVTLAAEEKDHATHNFLQWFVSEQVEEEATVREVVSRLRLVGKDGHGLFLVDRELSERGSPASGPGTERA